MNTDITTTHAMDPEDVPDALVEVAVMAIYDTTPDQWDDTPENIRQGAMNRHADDVRAALAATLPMYGAAVIVRGGVEHCDRQEALARSLTTRVARSSMLLQLASEATAAANQGIEPALNHKLADMLRKRAHREGAAS